jgi:lysophospholipase L1-like esterase
MTWTKKPSGTGIGWSSVNDIPDNSIPSSKLSSAVNQKLNTVGSATVSPKSVTAEYLGGNVSPIQIFPWDTIGWTNGYYINTLGGKFDSATSFTTDCFPVFPNIIYSIKDFSGAGSISGGAYGADMTTLLGGLGKYVVSTDNNPVTGWTKVIFTSDVKYIRRSFPIPADTTDSGYRTLLKTKYILMGDYDGKNYPFLDFANGKVNAPWLWNIDTTNPTQVTKYYQKSIFFFGDSITSGVGSTTTGGYVNVAQGKLGCFATNKGSSGSDTYRLRCIVGGGTTGGITYTAQDTSNAAACTIMIGTNQGPGTSTLADITGNTDFNTYPNSFYGNIGFCIEYFFSKNINTRVYLITPPQRTSGNMKDVADALKSIGAYYSIPVIDVNACAGINPKNMSVLMPDGTHPNDSGHTIIGQFVANQLNAF